jgi:hypothetical protein
LVVRYECRFGFLREDYRDVILPFGLLNQKLGVNMQILECPHDQGFGPSGYGTRLVSHSRNP